MVLLHRERGHFIFSCFRPLRLLPSSFLSLHVLERALVISSDPIDDTGWTGRLYWCHCGHGYPYGVRALRPHVMVIDDWRHASRRWFGIVVSIHSPGTAVCSGRVRALVAQHALCTNINNSGNSEHAEVSKTMISGLKRLQAT